MFISPTSLSGGKNEEIISPGVVNGTSVQQWENNSLQGFIFLMNTWLLLFLSELTFTLSDFFQRFSDKLKVLIIAFHSVPKIRTLCTPLQKTMLNSVGYPYIFVAPFYCGSNCTCCFFVAVTFQLSKIGLDKAVPLAQTVLWLTLSKRAVSE